MHDNAAFFGAGKQAAHPFGHSLLSCRKAGALRVGRIRQQSQHAAAAILRNGGKVGNGIAGKRRVVDLEVAGMQHGACRAVNGKRQRIRDRVVDMDGLHRKAAKAHFLAGTDLMELCTGGKTVLLQLVFDQAMSKRAV